jgi:hypothetical protein
MRVGNEALALFAELVVILSLFRKPFISPILLTFEQFRRRSSVLRLRAEPIVPLPRDGDTDCRNNRPDGLTLIDAAVQSVESK